MDAWDETDGKLSFRTRHEVRRTLGRLVVAGLVGSVASGLLAFVVPDDFVSALALGGALVVGAAALIGGILLLRAGATTVVPSERILVGPDGARRPFSDFGFVVTRKVTVRTRNEVSSTWLVGAVPVTDARDLRVEAHVAAREVLDRESTMGEAMADQAAETLALLEVLGQTSPVQVASYSDAARAWRAGEKLARTMEVPLLDLTGAPVLRRVDQLDTPLRALLAGEVLPTRPAGPIPEGLAETSGPPLRVTWVRHHPGVWLVLAAVVGLTAVGFFLPNGWKLFLPLAAVFGVLLPVASIGWGRQTLEVDASRLTLSGFLKRASVDLEKLEGIREDERTKDLEFVSDEVLVRAHLPSAEAARWLRLRVENHLKATAT